MINLSHKEFDSANLTSFSRWQWKLAALYGMLLFAIAFFLRNQSNLGLCFLFLLTAIGGLKVMFASVESAAVLRVNNSNLPNAQRTAFNVKAKMKNIADHNSHDLSYFSRYLKKTSDNLLGIFHDQFLILKKVEEHARHTRSLVGEVELRITDVTVSSSQAKAGADAGRRHMTDLSTSVLSLNEIGELLISFTKVLQGLTIQMKEIDNIVLTTKILSLNATLESARVGELGKGMSVVARDMTILSSQIGKTSSAIQITLKNSNDSLFSMNSKITNLISDSTGLINSSKSSLNSVIDEIYVLTDKISEMAGALSSYKNSTKQLDEIVDDITKASNTLGTASANTNLVKLNLEELSKYNEHCHQS